MMDIGRSAAVNGVADGGVLCQIVFQVHDRFGPSNKQDSVVVIQPPHFVWGKQFAATLLKISGVGTGSPLGLAMRFCVDGGLAKGLRNVFMGCCLITAKVQNRVGIARNCLP